MSVDRYRSGDLYGLMAEYAHVEDLRSAALRLKIHGYQCVRIYAPYPIPGLARMFRTMNSRIRYLLISPIVFFGGVTGALVAIAMQEYANLVSYPINIGGRPLNAWPMFVPVTFELTILFASFGGVLAVLVLNRLPQFYHPVFNVERFARASQDRFFICAEANDSKFDLGKTRALLEKTKAVTVEEVLW
ncbi:MAG TPA: DUF3341 domain-containing protein [Thermoanaerobaculia bacterium]|nr:DUF3341 domain-containing protein [Thermoanaerobaculia bacterium]